MDERTEDVVNEESGEPIEEAPEEQVEEVDPRDDIIAKLHNEKDQLLRAYAEQQNIARRLREQGELARKFAAEPLAKELLPVLDNFERTLKAAQDGASMESLIEGIKAIDRQFRKALESAGVNRIASLGAPFDPEVHEAAASLENPDYDDETVIEEISAGYTIHDRVIRAAQVVVSRKP